MSLRSDVGLEISPSLQTDAFLDKMKEWEKKGMASFKDNRILLQSQGYLMLDSLINDLFILKLL
jgi:oxygen-independent coproporphyrinogen-3 oxidase